MRNSSGIVAYCGNNEMALTLGRAAMRSSEGYILSNYPTATYGILLQFISDMSPHQSLVEQKKLSLHKNFLF